MSKIAPVVTLCNVHGFTAGMPHSVYRCAVVEAARLDDESIALPAAHRISEICRKFPSGGEFAAIRENLAVKTVHFVQNHGLLGSLHDFERFGEQPCHRPAILAVAIFVLPLPGGPPLHGRLTFGPQNGLSGL